MHHITEKPKGNEEDEGEEEEERRPNQEDWEGEEGHGRGGLTVFIHKLHRNKITVLKEPEERTIWIKYKLKRGQTLNLYGVYGEAGNVQRKEDFWQRWNEKHQQVGKEEDVSLIVGDLNQPPTDQDVMYYKEVKNTHARIDNFNQLFDMRGMKDSWRERNKRVEKWT